MINNQKITIVDEPEHPSREAFALIVFSDHLFEGISQISSTSMAQICATHAQRPLTTDLDLAKGVINRFTLSRNPSLA